MRLNKQQLQHMNQTESHVTGEKLCFFFDYTGKMSTRLYTISLDVVVCTQIHILLCSDFDSFKV